MRYEKQGPLEMRVEPTTVSTWTVVSEQFRAADGSWPFDVYLLHTSEARVPPGRNAHLDPVVAGSSEKWLDPATL